MDSQQTTFQNVEETSAKKNLLLPILAASLSGGAIVVYAIVAILLPLVLGVVNFVLAILGFIPILGLLFNILSFLLTFVSFGGSLITPFISILCFLAAIAGIVIGIIALVKSRANNSRPIYKVLSILGIVLGVLCIISMIVMIVLSIISAILNFVLCVVLIAINIASLMLL